MPKKHCFYSFGWEIASSLQQWVLEKTSEVVLEARYVAILANEATSIDN